MTSAQLEIDRLSKRFGDVVALSEMSLEVRSGEIFGFVGGNGAGKTTTMRIALGVQDADSGEVRWGGQPVGLSTWRRTGYMPEERGLYPKMKVGEQLAYFAELHGLSRKAAKVSVQIWAERLGVEARLDNELQSLSLGNQQRVQLAAALVHEPELLVLDEPFSGLDPLAVDVMSGVLRQQAEHGVPVMFSSHQLDLVERLCDRVGIVDKGRMVACGTVDELRSKGSLALVVRIDGAPQGWADALPGVLASHVEGDDTVLDVEHGIDEQVVLQAAIQAGTVRSFTFRRATLAETFRHVISEGAVAQ
jgi:ABC-2 type transport system ATP-binding protein